jgi:WD40 repeat protein
VRLWDAATGQLFGEMRTGAYGVDQRLAFSPLGLWLATNSGTGEVLIWDLRSESWRAMACRIANREMSDPEWAEFMGDRNVSRCARGTEGSVLGAAVR